MCFSKELFRDPRSRGLRVLLRRACRREATRPKLPVWWPALTRGRGGAVSFAKAVRAATAPRVSREGGESSLGRAPRSRRRKGLLEHVVPARRARPKPHRGGRFGFRASFAAFQPPASSLARSSDASLTGSSVARSGPS